MNVSANGASTPNTRPVSTGHSEPAHPDDKISPLDVPEEETRCGYTRACQPRWLQICARPKAFLVMICLSYLVQGFVINGVNIVNIAVYERRYLLDSKSSGLIASFNDIFAGVTVLFVGYFGATAHQPRILGMALLCLALGTLIMAMAHFTSPSYQPNTSINQTLSSTCSLAGGDVKCDVDDSQAYLQNYLYVLLLGQALNGLGGTCLHSLGITYLDESVSTQTSYLFLGILTGCAILGPGVGFIVGGILLQIYVEPGNEPAGLTPFHPAWVGAWWLGLLISTVLCVILAFFMFLFPKELPTTKAVRVEKISQAHFSGSNEDKFSVVGYGVSISRLPRAIWSLLKNPPFMFLTLVHTLEMGSASGTSAFFPKYIANQFALSLSWSAMLIGFLAIPGAAVGRVLGGLICKKCNFKVIGSLRFMLGLSILTLCTLPIMLARCPSSNMAGVDIPYPDSSGEGGPLELESPCNAGCGCDTAVYEPVCADGVQYFSPCHAGCSEPPIITEQYTMLYHNCGCPLSAGGNSSIVISGPCPTDCQTNFILFLVFLFISLFSGFMMGAPIFASTLRVVPDNQRSLAISLQWLFIRFLGNILGPLLFGALTDSTCQVFEDECGVTGSCWVYERFELSKTWLIALVVFKCLSILCTFLAMILYKPPPPKTAHQLTSQDNKAFTISESNSKENM